MRDDDLLIPVQSQSRDALPPVPVNLPLDAEGREQLLAASNLQKAIDLERFRSYSGISRVLHFLIAALLLLHDLIRPREVLFYEFAGMGEIKIVPTDHPGLEHWLMAERLLPLFIVFQTVLFHYLLPERIFSSRTKLLVEGWIDLLWTTVAVSITGGTSSPFMFLYLVVILNAAPTQTRITAISKAVTSTILISVAFLIADINGSQPLSNLIWPIAFLWIGSYLAGSYENIARSLNEQLLRETVRDDVTGLYTFKFFAGLPDSRSDWPYSIVLFDADYLKEINDNYGHEKGTELIQHAAEAIRAAAREGDICARLGGDEFIVRLKGSTREGALRYAERVRELAGRLPVQLPDSKEFPVNLSAGVACCPSDGKSMADIVRKADIALYAAKRAGRNRVTPWTGNLGAGSGSQFLGNTGMGGKSQKKV